MADAAIEPEAPPEGVERVVAPWTQRVQRGRVCSIVGATRISGSSRDWIRVVLDWPKVSRRSRLFTDSDSEDESEDNSDVDDKVIDMSVTQRDAGLRCVVEWLLLLHALACVDPAMPNRALAELPSLTTHLTALTRRLGTKGPDGKSAFGFVVAGLGATLSTVLELLTKDQDELSAEFKQARATILSEGTHLPSAQNAVAVRMKVNSSRRTTTGDTTDLDRFALAVRNAGHWFDQPVQTDFPPLVLDGVDFHVEDYQTLKWLAEAFPRESVVPIGELTCSGELGPTAQLEATAKMLLHGGEHDGIIVPPPRIQTLVLHNPLDTDALRVFCSAAQSAKSLKAISMSGVLQDYGREPEARTQRWQQFAAALFGAQATHTIQRVQINEWALLPEDVRAVVNAVSVVCQKKENSGACTPLTTASLDLSIDGVQGGTITPLVEFIRALRDRLPRLTDFTLSVSDDPVINDAVVLAVVEGFAPTLRTLSLKNVEVDSLGSLLSPQTNKRLRLRSLHVHNLFIGDMTSCSPFFEALLGDATNPIACHLEELRIDLSKRHSIDDVRTILSLVKFTLEQNPRIIRCEIYCHGDFGFAGGSLKSSLESLHGQPTVEPLGLESRAAFLSVFQYQISHRPEATKKPRVDQNAHALLPRPHQDGIAQIFAFAASATTRVALVHTKASSRSF